MGRKPGTKSKLLTETELEMMLVLWRKKNATAAEVQEALKPTKKLAITSVSTILRILEQKGFATSERVGRGHVYIPKMSQDEYQGRSVTDLVSRLFDRSPSHLVKCLLETKSLTPEELDQIRELLKQSEGHQ